MERRWLYTVFITTPWLTILFYVLWDEEIRKQSHIDPEKNRTELIMYNKLITTLQTYSM